MDTNTNRAEKSTVWKQSDTLDFANLTVQGEGELEASQVQGSNGNKGRVEPVKYRTSLCRHYHARGHCPYAPKCLFAHGEAELRTTYKNNSEGLTHIARLRQFQNKNASNVQVMTANQFPNASVMPRMAGLGNANTTSTLTPGSTFQVASFVPTGSPDLRTFQNTFGNDAMVPHAQFLPGPTPVFYSPQHTAGANAGSQPITYTFLPTGNAQNGILPAATGQPQAVYVQLSPMPTAGQPIYYTTAPHNS